MNEPLVDTNTWHRLHPLTPLIDGGVAVIIVLGIIVANLRDIIINTFIGSRWESSEDALQRGEESWSPFTKLFAEGRLGIAVLVLLGIILIGLGIAWLSWFYHSYQISDEAVEMRKGILIKQHRRAPLDRIQSVNLQRPLLARVCGLTKIEVQTGGHDGKVHLAFLAHEQAKQLRQQILVTAHSVHETPTVSEQNPEQPPSSVVDRHLNSFADEDLEDSSTPVVRVPHGRLIGSVFLGHEALFIYLVILALPILAITSSWVVLAGFIPAILALAGVTLSRLNRGFNFVLSEAGDGIRTGSGLTSTYTDTIPRHRIHAVDIAQPLLWRKFGWWRIRLTTAGSTTPGKSNNQAMFENIVLPVGTRDEVMRVIAIIAPHLANEEDIEQLADALDGAGTNFLGAPKRARYVLLFGRKRAGMRVSHEGKPDEALHIRRGAFTRHLVLMPLARTQSLMLHRPPLHRWLGLATLQLHTVPGPVSVTMRGLDMSDASQQWRLLAPKIVYTQHHDQPATRRRYGEESNDHQ